MFSNLVSPIGTNLELESQPIESNKDCKPLSNPKNLKLGGESNSDPIRLQRQQLKLLNLCIHSVHKNRVKLTLHGLTHERKVPNQHLRIFPSNSYMAWAMRGPRNRIHACLVPLQLHHREHGEENVQRHHLRTVHDDRCHVPRVLLVPPEPH